MDSELKKNIILEHYQNPINKGIKDDKGYYRVNMNSETCIDNLDFILKIDDNIITDARFDGEACAISTAASSIMINMVIGKTINEVLDIINNYENMIEEKEYNKDILGEANAFDEIYKQANRKKCALLPFLGIKKILLRLKEE